MCLSSRANAVDDVSWCTRRRAQRAWPRIENVDSSSERGVDPLALPANWPKPEPRAASVETLVPVTNSVTVDHCQEHAGTSMIADPFQGMNMPGRELGSLSQNWIAPAARLH